MKARTVPAFRYPSTGTRHLLKSDPEQATLRYPESDEFSARAYCGVEVKLRDGDLGEFPTVVDADEHPGACRLCLMHAPVLARDFRGVPL